MPEKSIGTDQGRKFLFVVNDRDEVEKRDDVRLGPQFGTYRVIDDPQLKPTDRVIVDGLLRVRPGTKVNPKPATERLSLPDTALAPVDVAPPPRSK